MEGFSTALFAEHDELAVTSALSAARDVETERMHQRQIHQLESELTLLRTTAKWKRRIAEDAIEAKWRKKTEVLLAQLCRLKLSEEDASMRLMASNAENKRLRRRVVELQKKAQQAQQQQQQISLDRSLSSNSVNRLEETEKIKVDINVTKKESHNNRRICSNVNLTSAASATSNPKALIGGASPPLRYAEYDMNGRRLYSKK